MKLYDLIDRIATVNKVTLEKHNIDLHKQRLVVKSLLPLDANHETERNTEVTLYANTHEVMGSQTYFYNRVIINDVIWPEEHHPRISLSDVNEKGLLQTLLDTNDPLIDEELVTELLNNEETNLTLHYTSVQTIDTDAYVSINCIGYYGIANLIVDIDEGQPIRLDDVLLGGELDGFDQSKEA